MDNGSTDGTGEYLEEAQTQNTPTCESSTATTWWATPLGRTLGMKQARGQIRRGDRRFN